MQAPTDAVVDEFAQAFAQDGRWDGLLKDEILAFFRRYSNSTIADRAMHKQDFFRHCLARLPVEDQYRALIDLCCQPPVSKNELPDDAKREALKEMLYAHSYSNGVSIRAVSLDSWPIKCEWLRAASRAERDPAGAVTSARTTLERTCREVLEATGARSRSDDLGALVKAARKALNLNGAADLAAVGVTNIVNAIAEGSNAAGDRHASRDNPGVTIAEARLMCDMSLALCLFLIDHLKVQPISTE